MIGRRSELEVNCAFRLVLQNPDAFADGSQSPEAVPRRNRHSELKRKDSPGPRSLTWSTTSS